MIRNRLLLEWFYAGSEKDASIELDIVEDVIRERISMSDVDIDPTFIGYSEPNPPIDVE
jgi:hypothetical protein